MNQQSMEILEKIRRQFDDAPYPNIPLDENPKEEYKTLYKHNLTTSYYIRNQQVLNPENKVILDAGCGTGYKSLILATANPGAKIIGVDLSEESVKLADQRLKYHGISDAEFYALSIEDLPDLGMQFDYINCDEVLYLLPNPILGLKAMKAVLKPDGIIRVNFHSSLQRFIYLQAQKFFNSIGVMDNPSQKEQVEAVREFMSVLKPNVQIKSYGWAPHFEKDDEVVLANYLLQGDKGWTIPEFFAALREADLEFISMVNWYQWDLMNLFDNVEDLPVFVAIALAEKSFEEQLHLFELLNPTNRLLDLWCGNPGAAQPFISVEEWSFEQWRSATVHLHPQCRIPALKEELITCVTHLKMFELSQYFRTTDDTVTIDSLMAGCLLPLMDQPQPMMQLVERLQLLRPVSPVTLAATDPDDAFELVRQLLIPLERLGYVFVEQA